MRVLFVDDEPEILKQAEIFLKEQDERFDIDTVNSGEKAIEKLKNEDYEAVVADYKLSGMDGIELLRKFRKKEENKPFIILTGRGREKVAMNALNLGADRYLQKKDDPEDQYEELAESIVREVKNYRAREREKFLYSLLRHDVRNKAQIVKEYHALLEETNLDEEQEKYLKSAKKTTESAIELIEKIRKIRKVSEETPKKVNLAPIIENAIEKGRIENYDGEFEISHNQYNCIVLGGTLLKDIFYELVENSIHHSNGDKIRITSKESNNKCTIVVEDNGKGIPEDIRGDIFKKSWSGRGKRGSGLGLYLAKTVVEKYEGEIELKDSELGGARFDVHLKKFENLSNMGAEE